VGIGAAEIDCGDQLSLYLVNIYNIFVHLLISFSLTKLTLDKNYFTEILKLVIESLVVISMGTTAPEDMLWPARFLLLAVMFSLLW
jgi:hypothetical protein